MYVSWRLGKVLSSSYVPNAHNRNWNNSHRRVCKRTRGLSLYFSLPLVDGNIQWRLPVLSVPGNFDTATRQRIAITFTTRQATMVCRVGLNGFDRIGKYPINQHCFTADDGLRATWQEKSYGADPCELSFVRVPDKRSIGKCENGPMSKQKRFQEKSRCVNCPSVPNSSSALMIIRELMVI